MGIPINALFDSDGMPTGTYQGRNARQWIEPADAVVAERTRHKLIVAFEIDRDEIGLLCTLVEAVKGYHELKE